jgi:hypothetical protein
MSERTRSRKDFLGYLNLDRRRLSLGVARARGKKPTGDKLVHPFEIAVKIVGVGCRMDRRMGFIVLPAIARPLESPLDQPNEVRTGTGRGYWLLTAVRKLPRCYSPTAFELAS